MNFFEIWKSEHSDSNGFQTYKHIARKPTLNYLANPNPVAVN